MSTTYNVLTGDTFESIDRKKYGDETKASRIASANPGATEPLTAGISLVIPVLPGTPQDVPQQALAADNNEVAVLLNGERFRFWSNIRIIRSLDAMDTVEFSTPSNTESAEFREAFRPFSFKSIVVTVGGIPLFTGTMVRVDPRIVAEHKIVNVSGYSLPGVLNDCTAPASAFPLEFNEQGLQEIATTLAAMFGLAVEFQVDQGAIFERVAVKPDKKVLSFLIKLAKQRNLVTSSTTKGALLIWQSVEVGNPVARLQQGTAPVLAVEPIFNPQEYYSHVTGLEPVFVGSEGAQFTVKNTHLDGAIRPFTFEVPDTEDADIKAAVEAKIGRMFGNMAPYSVSVATWRDPSGELWTPNTTITLVAPDAMVYREYEFVIRSIAFERKGDSETAVLTLSIPGAFSGKIPGVLPWDE